MLTSTDKTIAVLLFVFAFGLYAALVTDTQALIGQFPKYPSAALRFLQGGLDHERLLDYSPVYLGLCIFVVKYLAASFQSLLWIQLFLVGLTVATLFLVLRRYFDRRLAFFGSLAFLLNVGVMVYAGVFEPEPLMMALLVLLVLFIGWRTALGSFFAGAILVLCLFTRPTVLFLALAVPVYLWLNLSARDRTQAIACFLAPVIIGIAFFAYQSIHRTHSFPPPLMNPGTVFFEGNSPLASGAVVEYPPLVIELADESRSGEDDYDHVIYRKLARSASPVFLNQTETNRIWATGAINFIMDQPIHYLGQLTRKLYYVFHSFQWHDLSPPHRAEALLKKRFIPVIPLALVSALALFGLVVGIGRWRVFFLYYLFFFNQVAVMLMTYTSARQRLALIPFLIFFAVVGLDWLLRRRSSRFVPVLVLILLTGFFFVDSDLMRSKWSLWENYTRHKAMKNEVYRLRDEGRLFEAAGALARSYAAAPWLGGLGIRPGGVSVPPEGLVKMALREFPAVRSDDPDASFDRSLLLLEDGDLDKAEQVLTQLLDEGHTSYRCINRPAQPTYYLGRIAQLRGRQAEAIKFMEAALEQAPGDPAILAQLAALTNDPQFPVKLTRYFGELNALYFLAMGYLENGQSAQAAEELRQLIKKYPGYWRGEVRLAAALADVGRDEEAVATYMKAMERGGEPVMWAEKILPAFKRRAELSAVDDSAWFWYAVALRQSGYFLESRDILKRSLALSDSIDVKKALADVEETIRRAGLR